MQVVLACLCSLDSAERASLHLLAVENQLARLKVQHLLVVAVEGQEMALSEFY